MVGDGGMVTTEYSVVYHCEFNFSIHQGQNQRLNHHFLCHLAKPKSNCGNHGRSQDFSKEGGGVTLSHTEGTHQIVT